MYVKCATAQVLADYEGFVQNISVAKTTIRNQSWLSFFLEENFASFTLLLDNHNLLYNHYLLENHNLLVNHNSIDNYTFF